MIKLRHQRYLVGFWIVLVVTFALCFLAFFENLHDENLQKARVNLVIALSMFLNASFIVFAVSRLKTNIKTKYPHLKFNNKQFYFHITILMLTSFMFFLLVFLYSYYIFQNLPSHPARTPGT